MEGEDVTSFSPVSNYSVNKINKRQSMDPCENTTRVSAGVDRCTYNNPNSQGRGRKTSVVWDVFVEVARGEDNKRRAECKRCGKKFICEVTYGTSSMKRHIDNCPRNQTGDITQLFVSQAQGPLLMQSPKFDPDTFRELLIAVIIEHDFPFYFFELEGIRDTFRYLSSDIQLPSRHTVEADVLRMFKREKSSLKDLLNRVPGRICLTSDLWSSIATDSYLTLTAHFIDLDWKLNKRILNFCLMPPPITGVTLSEKIHTLLSEWGIENKLFSFTLDNASSNDCFVDILKCKLKSKNALIINGDLFHIRCCAHILNLIVQDSLKEIDESVLNIRESIKYVKGSAARKQKFFECVSQVSPEIRKGFRGDIPTRWDLTYLMLKGAVFYRNAFIRLQLTDTNYKHCPSEEEWIRVKKILELLQVFYNFACLFSSTKCPTTNLYFPQVFAVQITLKGAIMDSDCFMQRMSSEMNAKFDKYWSDNGLIFAIAVVLDPRYKLNFVEWAYSQVYGIDTFEFDRVRDTLNSLFHLYLENLSHCSSNLAGESETRPSVELHGLEERNNLLEEFERWREHNSITTKLYELQRYLDEPTLDRKENLDILTYWSEQQFRYPILSHLARDVLSIPISTVASDSEFSIGGRVLDPYRSSLSPETLQALLCTRDWIYDKKTVDDPLVDLEDDFGDIFSTDDPDE